MDNERTDVICEHCRVHTKQILLLGKWVCDLCGRPQKDTKKEEVCKPG
jgi:ribosomal protein L37AE/L43A